jgi:tetratricopeptide (TPR) repeat protein
MSDNFRQGRDSASTRTLFHEAVSLHRQGRISQAREAYEAILGTEPANIDALHLLGVLFSQANDHLRAVALIDKAIALHPDNAIFHSNRGVALLALKRFGEAVASYDRAIAIQPDIGEAHYNRAIALDALGRFEEAAAGFDRAIALRSDNAEACQKRGVALQKCRRFEEAIASYDRAIDIRPDHAEAFCNRGIALAALGRFDEAIASYDRAVAIRPGFSTASYNRGISLAALTRFEEAIASYDRAISLVRNDAEAFCNRGIALAALGRLNEAISSYDRAIDIRPDYAEAWSNRGAALMKLGRSEEAIASYEHAITIRPGYAEAFSNRGLALMELNRLDDALSSFDRAISLRPDYAEAWSNRGIALSDLARPDSALSSFDRAIDLRPGYAEALWNKSLTLLSKGNFEKGWELFEWRWKKEEFTSRKRNFHEPLWLGRESLKGRTILLHGEQGLGDTIQFCRFAKLVSGLGARVVLEVQPPLAGLLTQLEGVAEVVANGEPLPSFDLHCPLMSLPLALKTGMGTIPPAPYLKADAARITGWEQRLVPRMKPRVGVVWSGNPAQKNEHNRRVPLEMMLRHLPEGVDYVSLQKEVRDDDLATLRSQERIVHFGPELKDFADTAALCSQMDMVVSVDTGVAHLCGALGMPALLLLSRRADWRWLLDRSDSPWYPSMTLYRQQTLGDWTETLARAGANLASRLHDS